jgi:hypothetical protein
MSEQAELSRLELHLGRICDENTSLKFALNNAKFRLRKFERFAEEMVLYRKFMDQQGVQDSVKVLLDDIMRTHL